MDSVNILYGQSLTLPVDTGDITDLSADIYIGLPGQVYILTKHTDLVNGQGNFVFDSDDTSIPIGKYFYQINVTPLTGGPDKYPSPEGCSDCDEEFPEFNVFEALDVVGVS